MEIIESPEPFYSMSRRAGDMLFLSGCGPVKDGKVIAANIEEQTIFTMDAMKEVLQDLLDSGRIINKGANECMTDSMFLNGS